MAASLVALLRIFAQAGACLLVVNEVRGFVLAAPVMLAMYESGGTWMTVWLGFSSLAGIALSVALPAFALRRLSWRAGEPRQIEARATAT